METTRRNGAMVALISLGLALGTACAPTPRANAVTVTYYYMPG